MLGHIRPYCFLSFDLVVIDFGCTRTHMLEPFILLNDHELVQSLVVIYIYQFFCVCVGFTFMLFCMTD